jgi:hypothetical protein
LAELLWLQLLDIKIICFNRYWPLCRQLLDDGPPNGQLLYDRLLLHFKSLNFYSLLKA